MLKLLFGRNPYDDLHQGYMHSQWIQEQAGARVAAMFFAIIVACVVGLYFGNVWLTERCYERAASVYGLTDPTAKAVHCNRNRWS